MDTATTFAVDRVEAFVTSYLRAPSLLNSNITSVMGEDGEIVRLEAEDLLTLVRAFKAEGMTTLDSPEAVDAYMAAKGTKGPTLHPNANVPDLGYKAPYRWSGWNTTMASGTDAEGKALVVKTHHYSNYPEPSLSVGVNGDIPYAGDHHHCWEKQGVVFPIRLHPAQSIINHPEHTPED